MSASVARSICLGHYTVKKVCKLEFGVREIGEETRSFTFSRSEDLLG